jgi:hypothetical protein
MTVIATNDGVVTWIIKKLSAAQARIFIVISSLRFLSPGWNGNKLGHRVPSGPIDFRALAI